MIEAVGHEHLQAYFRTLGAMLRRGGKCVVQVRAGGAPTGKDCMVQSR
jgi:cyclopropane fatty-acyl-phospholipid synthase-like methyltransferase